MKNSKKLLISLATLVLALALTASTTFAWFTMSATPSVGGFDLTATTGDTDLLICLNQTKQDDGDYKSHWTTAEAEAALTTQLAKALKPVTTTDGIKFTDEAVSATDVSANYVSFKVYFKSATKYKISLTSGAVAPKGAYKSTAPAYAWETNDAVKYGKATTKNTALETRAAYASRVSFGAANKVWDPHIDTVESYYKNAADHNLAYDYRALIAKETAGTLVAPLGVSRDTLGDLLTLTGTEGAYKGELTVSIWLEGWDGDCLNVILGDKFTVDLGFTGVKVA